MSNDGAMFLLGGAAAMTVMGFVLKSVLETHLKLPDRVLALEKVSNVMSEDIAEMRTDMAISKTAAIESRVHLEYIREAIDRIATKEK